MKKKEQIYTKIREKAAFEFGLRENAEKVAVALASSGYYVKIMGGYQGNNYHVWVYTDREL